MMWLNILAIVSGVASIVSLFLTIREARKAKTAAASAIEAKEAVFAKQSTLELTGLLEAARKIESILKKRTANNRYNNQGLSPEKDHKDIEDFISVLNESKSIHPNKEFEKILEVEYDFFCDANNKSPKPYSDMLAHIRIVISQTSRVMKTSIYLQ
ncbi:MAG: hypothetical protein NC453_18315 [Muribaculum sp.]|nr:hypothetical protein [Muribaculum sp.]